MKTITVEGDQMGLDTGTDVDVYQDIAVLRDKYKLDWDEARVLECVLQYAQYGERHDIEAAIWHATRLLNGDYDGTVK